MRRTLHTMIASTGSVPKAVGRFIDKSFRGPFNEKKPEVFVLATIFGAPILGVVLGGGKLLMDPNVCPIPTERNDLWSFDSDDHLYGSITDLWAGPSNGDGASMQCGSGSQLQGTRTPVDEPPFLWAPE